jgi:hypothetical protein
VSVGKPHMFSIAHINCDFAERLGGIFHHKKPPVPMSLAIRNMQLESCSITTSALHTRFMICRECRSQKKNLPRVSPGKLEPRNSCRRPRVCSLA